MLQMVKMREFAQRAVVATTALLMVGCGRVELKGFIIPTGDVVNSRFEQSFDLHNAIPTAQLQADEEYLFYVCTDPHISDTTDNLRSWVADLRGDGSALFGVVMGDCIDKLGSMPTYVEALNHLQDSQESPTPIFSALGNHDLYFSQWEQFRELVGPSVYWFEVAHEGGKDLFVVLDTASGTLGSRQSEWLATFLDSERPHYRHCIIITHTNLLYTDNSQVTSGNLPFEESMWLFELFDKHDILLCLQGHDHHREDLTFRGVRYTTVGTIRDEFPTPEYLCILVTPQGVEYEWRVENKE